MVKVTDTQDVPFIEANAAETPWVINKPHIGPTAGLGQLINLIINF